MFNIDEDRSSQRGRAGSGVRRAWRRLGPIALAASLALGGVVATGPAQALPPEEPPTCEEKPGGSGAGCQGTGNSAQFKTKPTPTLSGVVKVGLEVTAVPGTWVPTPDQPLSYQWKIDGQNIVGATQASYTPVAADANRQLTVGVTARKQGYTDGYRVSAVHVVQPAVVVDLPFTTAPEPTITGLAKVGSELTAVPGGWDPAPTGYGFQWTRDGAQIDGANTAKYTLTAADAGKFVGVLVTATKTGYQPTGRSTAGTETAPASFDTKPRPAVTVLGGGPARFGVKLRAVAGQWAPTPDSLAYQWLRNGKAIDKANAAEYTVGVGDIGKSISVRVAGIRVGYEYAPQFSSAVKPTPNRLTATPKPKIKVLRGGKAKVGKKLAVKTGAWKPAKVTLKYQWLRNGKAIKGATKSKYRIAKKDRGKRISVRVTGKKTGYATVAKTSSAKKVRR